MSPQPDTLLGRYELGEQIGVGGMATVRRAFDARLERNVAVKLLAEHLADDTQFVQRFQREAKSAAKLVHPNIVQVFDYGFDPEHGRYYIVMEYIQGRSGAQLLTEYGRLSVDQTLHLADGACRALAHAHRHGVIHRDVKPGNLMLAADGQVKLADFGIAWAGDSLSVTQHGAVLGTIAYLAPEQSAGGQATPQADIYALGVVLFQLITGRLPFAGQSLPELVLAQQRQTPPTLDRLVAGVPRNVAGAVASALSYDPNDRPASASEMREELLGDPSRTAATRMVTADADVTSVTRLGADPDKTGVTRMSRRAAITGGAAAAAGVDPAVAKGAVQRLKPHAGPPRPVDPYAAPAPYEDPRDYPPAKRGSGAGRVFGFLLFGLLMLAVGAAVGYWLSGQVSDVGTNNGLNDLFNQLGGAAGAVLSRF
jgi:hypothetical protein